MLSREVPEGLIYDKSMVEKRSHKIKPVSNTAKQFSRAIIILLRAAANNNRPSSREGEDQREYGRR
jgi:hypothetical protein